MHAIDAILYRGLLERFDKDDAASAAEFSETQLVRYRKLTDSFGTSRKMDFVAKQVRFAARFLPQDMGQTRTALEELATMLET